MTTPGEEVRAVKYTSSPRANCPAHLRDIVIAGNFNIVAERVEPFYADLIVSALNDLESLRARAERAEAEVGEVDFPGGVDPEIAEQHLAAIARAEKAEAALASIRGCQCPAEECLAQSTTQEGCKAYRSEPTEHPTAAALREHGAEMERAARFFAIAKAEHRIERDRAIARAESAERERDELRQALEYAGLELANKWIACTSCGYESNLTGVEGMLANINTALASTASAQDTAT